VCAYVDLIQQAAVAGLPAHDAQVLTATSNLVETEDRPLAIALASYLARKAGIRIRDTISIPWAERMATQGGADQAVQAFASVLRRPPHPAHTRREWDRALIGACTDMGLGEAWQRLEAPVNPVRSGLWILLGRLATLHAGARDLLLSGIADPACRDLPIDGGKDPTFNRTLAVGAAFQAELHHQDAIVRTLISVGEQMEDTEFFPVHPDGSGALTHRMFSLEGARAPCLAEEPWRSRARLGALTCLTHGQLRPTQAAALWRTSIALLPSGHVPQPADAQIIERQFAYKCPQSHHYQSVGGGLCSLFASCRETALDRYAAILPPADRQIIASAILDHALRSTHADQAIVMQTLARLGAPAETA